MYSRNLTPVKVSGYLGFSCRYPTFFRISSDCFQESRPKIVAEPSSGFRNPIRMWIVVVFPAPFGPTNPEIPPPSFRFSSFNALIFPNDLVRFLVSMVVKEFALLCHQKLFIRVYLIFCDE